MSNNIYQRGFTLIEALIALSIIAISMVGAISLTSETTKNLHYIIEKTHAHWVAESALATVLAGKQGFHLTTGDQKGVMKEGETNWYWQADIKSLEPELLAVNISVTREKNNDAVENISVIVHENKTMPA